MSEKIVFNKLILGAHTPFCKNIYDSLKKSIDEGMTCTQFFMGNPKSFIRSIITQEDIDSSLELCKKFPLHVFSHFPYVSNLAGKKKVLVWNGNTEQDIKTLKIIEQLEYELGILSNFDNNGVIIHPGNHIDREKGVKAISQSINKINFKSNSNLLLENSAGQGTTLATTFEEIKAILDGVSKNKLKHVGVCLDTAHIFGYGLYNLSDCKEVEKMFDDFDRVIGLDRLKLIHLNDSKVKLGSRKDRHACIGTGFIWGENKNSLMLLLNKCKTLSIPLLLETEISDVSSVSSFFSTKN